MKFNQYHIAPAIKKRLVEIGFKKPTDIQYKAIPSVLKGEDVLAIAQTGTGKTAAFVIPTLHLLLNKKNISLEDNHIRCIIMVPTRELAIQLSEVCSDIGCYTQLSVANLHGGISQIDQVSELEFGLDILVCTPGRLFDLKHQGYVNLSKVEILIIDEADKMLALGFYKDIQDVVKYLPRKHQTLFFSATINAEIKKLAYALVKNPVRIQLSPKDPISKNVTHQVMYVNMDDKRFFLQRIINENENKKILVFVRTKVRAERVLKFLNSVNIEALTLHSDKSQDERFAILDAFRNNECNILIATDISARGLDIPGIAIVVNYDVPEQSENYVHRIGRTGRAFEKGTAITFCDAKEKDLIKEIENYIGKNISPVHVSQKEKNITQIVTGHKDNDWQSLVQDIDEWEQKLKYKKKK